ncbi:hypothetical protein [Rufibacter hautae]|uniref:Uncharacterized protein n=1 Tax=Rufibacter hautae TaxID=2595005 RepID=A0A5B6TGL8_9BACT|nr:hypothetical protein [Rufibacter hautae]KAA3439413.1 hypothetical protein FOA19_01625 [Rufibacter hautae]
MTRLIFVVFFLGLTFNAFSSSCVRPNEKNWLPIVQQYIQESDAIFIGEVIGAKNHTTIIKVLDVFKGKVSTDTVYLSADLRYESLGFIKKWPLGVTIFYTQPTSANSYVEFLINNSCGMSRNLTELPTFTPVVPVTQDVLSGMTYDEDKLLREVEASYRQIQPFLLKNWINEYALLNAYRNNHREEEEPQSSKSDYLSYLAVALSLVAVLVAFYRKQR